MSAIAGVFHRNGRPASRDDASRLAAAVPHRGPDGAFVWTDGAVALSHQAFRTSRGDAEPQPVVDQMSRRAIVFDGRLDNRSELAGAVAVDGDASDARLVLAAHARWGGDAPAHLLGDFAFAIWDAAAGELFCARDPIGVRPFYYVLDRERFVWATDHRALLRSGVVAVRPNESMVGEYLARSFRTRTETLFGGVSRLPGGATLTVTRASHRHDDYWRPDRSPDLNHQTDRECAEHFFQVFGDAVACRLDSTQPVVAAYLSGGLDSSSVVAMTQALGASCRVPEVETFSMVFPDDPTADERRYIDDVVTRWGVASHRVRPKLPAASAYRGQALEHLDVPDNPSDHLAAALRGAVRDRGIRVVLTGAGGDHGFAGTLSHYAELLQARAYAAAWHQLRADMRIRDVGWSPSAVFTNGVLPLLPRWLKDAVRPAARRAGWPGGVPAWIDRAFARRIALEDRLRTPARPGPFGRAAVCDAFHNGTTEWALELVDRTAADFGIEERHPFFDRRVVEFAVGIPERQRWRGTETKYVLRHAMGDLLPARVSARTDKADFSLAAAAAVETLVESGVFARLRTAALGWVDADVVGAMYRDMKRRSAAGDERFIDNVFPLWMTGGVELWSNSWSEA